MQSCPAHTQLGFSVVHRWRMIRHVSHGTMDFLLVPGESYLASGSGYMWRTTITSVSLPQIARVSRNWKNICHFNLGPAFFLHLILGVSGRRECGSSSVPKWEGFKRIDSSRKWKEPDRNHGLGNWCAESLHRTYRKSVTQAPFRLNRTGFLLRKCYFC